MQQPPSLSLSPQQRRHRRYHAAPSLADWNSHKLVRSAVCVSPLLRGRLLGASARSPLQNLAAHRVCSICPPVTLNPNPKGAGGMTELGAVVEHHSLGLVRNRLSLSSSPFLTRPSHHDLACSIESSQQQLQFQLPPISLVVSSLRLDPPVVTSHPPGNVNSASVHGRTPQPRCVSTRSTPRSHTQRCLSRLNAGTAYLQGPPWPLFFVRCFSPVPYLHGPGLA